MNNLNTFLLVLFFVLYSTVFNLSAQVVNISNYDCPNVNTSLQGNSAVKSLVEGFTDTLYPRGTMLFDFAYESVYISAENVANVIAVDPDISFQMTSSHNSFFSSSNYTVRYQQYYKGVKVDGGGYTASYKTHSDPDNPNEGPCDDVYAFSPFIITIPNTSVIPSVNEADIPTIIINYEGASDPSDFVLYKSDLIISHNLNNGCTTQLSYVATYFLNGTKRAYIDAQTGQVLLVLSEEADLQATTQDYGVVDLDNRNASGGGKEMVTSDGQVKTYDLNGTPVNNLPKSAFSSNKIPVTTASSWTTEAPEAVYQAHFCADLIMGYYAGIFSTLDISLGTLHVGANGSGSNAIWYNYSENDNTFVGFGSSPSGNSFATLDVMGHEIGHGIISRFIDYGILEGGSLHEALADLFGVYAEYKYYGIINWEMGNEIPATSRDLSNIPSDRDCFDEVDHLFGNDSGSKHFRANPLRHLIYLMTEGDASLGIPGLGIEKTLAIMLESIQKVKDNADYSDLREAMIQVIETTFGRCSDEAKAVFRAWCEICVGPSYFCNYQCNLVLSGQTYWCEEGNSLQVCIAAPTGGVMPQIQNGRWTILFKDGLNWVSATGTQTGNTVIGTGVCLSISSFPKYPYYPQDGYIKFTGYDASGQRHVARKRVVLRDCNHDDPTCEEYYGLNGLKQNDTPTHKTLIGSAVQEYNSEIAFHKVYDLQGRLIMEANGKFVANHRLSPADRGGKVLLVCSFNSDGRMIFSKKIVILN